MDLPCLVLPTTREDLGHTSLDEARATWSPHTRVGSETPCLPESNDDHLKAALVGGLVATAADYRWPELRMTMRMVRWGRVVKRRYSPLIADNVLGIGKYSQSRRDKSKERRTTAGENSSRERTLREEMWGEIQYTYHSDSGRTTSRVDRSGLAAKSMVSISGKVCMCSLGAHLEFTENKGRIRASESAARKDGE